MKKKKKIQEPTIILHEPPYGLTVVSSVRWYERLWYLISNPFRYLFTGKIKY